MAKDVIQSQTSPSGFAPTRPIGAIARGQRRPNFGDRTRPFLFAANPNECELVQTSQGWRLVPVLKPLFVAPAVNNTAQPKKGGVLSHTRVQADAQSKWALIVLDNRDEYQVEIEGEGAPGIFTAWERVRIYSDGKWSIDHDSDGYDLWRWSLVASGRVELRDEGIQIIRRRIRRQKDRASRTPHIGAAQRAMEDADKREAGLVEALAALRSGEAPKPDARDAKIAELEAKLKAAAKASKATAPGVEGAA